MQEILVDAGTPLGPLEFFDQVSVPAGVHHPETVFLDEQRNGVEPLQELVPFVRVIVELFQGFPNKPVVPGVVLAQPLFPAARPGPGAVAQGIVLVVAHHDAGRAVLHHVPHQVQSLPDARSPVDDVADEDGLALGVLVHAVAFAIAHLLQQPDQGVGAAVDVADDVVTAVCGLAVCCHDQLAEISLAQPSLSRQVA